MLPKSAGRIQSVRGLVAWAWTQRETQVFRFAGRDGYTECDMCAVESIAFLAEKNVFEDQNPARLLAFAKSGGIPCAHIAFESVSASDDDLRPASELPFAEDIAVFVYGSMNLMKWLGKQRRWPKLAWCDFSRFRCQEYYARCGAFLLQREYAFVPLAEVDRRREWLFKTFGKDNAVFVRPDDNAKSFAGGLVHRAEFDTWFRRANFYEPGPECLAVVARPERILAEWRLAIGHGKVIAGSQYRAESSERVLPVFDAEAGQFAELVVAQSGFSPHPIFVMDVALTDDGYRLLEVGSVNCSSLYAMDVDRLGAAIVQAAQG